MCNAIIMGRSLVIRKFHVVKSKQIGLSGSLEEENKLNLFVILMAGGIKVVWYT